MVDDETAQSEQGGASNEGSTFEAIGWALRAILKHWAIILAAVLLTSGIALAYSKSVPRAAISASSAGEVGREWP